MSRLPSACSGLMWRPDEIVVQSEQRLVRQLLGNGLRDAEVDDSANGWPS